MIKKILIANRGEISKRVIQTCRRLDIETVSIYAQDDAGLAHALESDKAICLGRGALADTYLNKEKIIEIAKEHACDAIHPGYGFLSENTEFCSMVNKAGIIFIGPSTTAIELMGDKKASKVKMEELGIPVVPGYHGDDQSESILFEKAKKIGFPVLIKATAGGGGKGMRIVRSEQDFKSALESSKREAKNAFANDKVLLEKYIETPRHIEVQLVSDGEGNHFHFFERECSIQRRYQKVIEETPSPALDNELRVKICETAVKIAQGIDYRGAGTIEFILGPAKQFYFLEMNTRLQVEHPVTEMVTGYDLVELQIKAAAGEAFNFTQKDIKQQGHSIECRIYAEDPDNEFLPTSGRIQQISVDGLTDFRLDCGYYDGSKISTNYDPMLAKLIIHADNRQEAIDKIKRALSSVVFGGSKTNRDYLRRLLSHPEFEKGNIHTHFIDQYQDDLLLKELPEAELAAVLAAGVQLGHKTQDSVWDANFSPVEKMATVNADTHKFMHLLSTQTKVEIELAGIKYTFEVLEKSIHHVHLVRNKQDYIINTFSFNTQGEKQLFCNDKEVLFKLLPKAQGKSQSLNLSEGSMQSPMPGKIFKVIAKRGQSVKKGEDILILEAMKMEHTIRAPKDGVIKDIFFQAGDQIQGGVLLCEIE